ncbi:fimbria/pilus periplasmic chaperone [Microbulbifer hainanensis]|uniref:fimbria/pilus periplasmic chaperone n=1 Tax=Microbulbifer hainanensis TaxID=2735675 RepID=UPI001868FD9E|nr:fimbria/pilus periplasmic chaperone [Microbulbifer hainanensis]
MLRNMFGLAAGLLMLALFAQGALCFTLEPTVTVLRLPADITGQTLVLKNPREVDLPVVFEIFERQINEDGSEVTTPADDDFVIFPPQAVVPAGKAQAVRIQWVGGALSQSRSFTLYASEQPLNLSGQAQSGVQTILRMGASVHVTNQGFMPTPKLIRYHPVPDGVVVSIKNNGNEFLYIDMLKMKFGREEVGAFELANDAGRTLITPGATRTFKVDGVQGVPELHFGVR